MAKNTASQMSVKPSAEGLAAAASVAAKRGLPPVHLWNPPHCGDIGMEIRRDGTWFYQGTPIGRAPLVRLFSTILRKDPDEYVLVTPAEKVTVHVEDVPFIAQDAEVTGKGEGQEITFTTNVGDSVTAGPDHPIRVERDAETGEPAPYVLVRAALEARIDRKTFYRLVEIGEHAERDGVRWFGFRSGGAFFPVIPSAELP